MRPGKKAGRKGRPTALVMTSVAIIVATILISAGFFGSGNAEPLADIIWLFPGH
jgi:hypothetical protein